MRILILLLLGLLTGGTLIAKGKTIVKTKNKIPNRLIDYRTFQNTVNASSGERESRRLTEEEFLRMMKMEEVILLDARSESRYKLRHIRGAISLPFTEFTKESLAQAIPKSDSKILIYCNNNFTGSPQSFAAKAPAASLNLSTYVSLKAYGYTNVYELGPLLDIKTTSLPFEGTELE
ncbi:rhodanese-like domain-containing protein [Leptospira gomenensis]|uniref:rhodanese-like domain-containing protein n=1 Tax=Leptospira gomenensis TaxID=2484974 RepID=UPI0014385D5E|nr:rhodanese-like domain-containing protein [Leptospira gomenensis]